MEPRPSIGITTHGRGENGRFDVNAKYVDAVRRAGGYAVLLPPGETRPEECLEFLDGIVLTGGPDVAPELYRGRRHPEVYGVDPERDASEIALVRALVEFGKPTLAICRGMQMLNVALGGSLVEHVPDEAGTRVPHRDGKDYVPHDVEVEPRSRLFALVRSKRITTPSWHHQAVRVPAPGFQVVARADDGVIEAIEHPDLPDLVAVQWHPEHTAATDRVQQGLFDALVASLR